MVLDVSQIRADSATTTVSYGGGEMEVGYLPSVATPEWERRISQAGDHDTLCKALLELLTRWDLLEDGEPIPLDESSLKSLPYGLLRAIFEAVWADIAGGEEEGADGEGLSEADRLRLFLKSPKIASGEDPSLFAFNYYTAIQDAKYVNMRPDAYVELPAYWQRWIHVSRTADEQLEQERREKEAKANRGKR